MKKALLFSALLLSTVAYAEPTMVTWQEAQRVILGAAADESYTEMYAIACALRNRNDVLVEENRAEIEHLPASLKDLALKAWRESKDGRDVTGGATSWWNAPNNGGYMFSGPHPSMKDITAKIGRHYFFKSDYRPKRQRWYK